MSRRRSFVFLVLAALLVPRLAAATFHLAKIDEVMTAYGGDPAAQFVEIRMLTGSQNLVQGTTLAAFDASGNFAGDVFAVPTKVPNSGAGVRWLMGTAAYAALGGPAPDFVIPAGLPVTGGMVCWGKPSATGHSNPANYVDCVAYGTFSGPKSKYVCKPTPIGAEGHSLRRAGDTTNLRNDLVCGDPATPQNNAGAVGSLAATIPCPPAVPQHDSVVTPPAPLAVTLNAGTTSVVRSVQVLVANGDVACGAETPGHTIQLTALDNDCPAGTVGTPDFNAIAAGAQSSALVVGGRTATARVPLTISSDAFASFNRVAPKRCIIVFNAEATVPGNTDVSSDNNTAVLEVSVIDRNDPEQTAVHESYVKSVAPLKVSLPDNTVTKAASVQVTAGNADLLPTAETPGHLITVTASDGDCPQGTMGLADLNLLAAGAQTSAVVRGNATVNARVSLTVDAGVFDTENASSPARCTASITATGPGGDTEATNDTTLLTVDVTDNNDF